MDAWERIRQLINRELQTEGQRKTFIIDAVGAKSLVVIPEGAYPHAIKRERIERAIEMHDKNGEITRAQIQKEFRGNRTTSYIHAICLELKKPGTTN